MNYFLIYETTAQIILGGLITIVIAAVFEYLKQPKLYFKYDPEICRVENRYNGSTASIAVFLTIQLWNRKPPWMLFWLNRNTADHCSGHITFHFLEDGGRAIDKAMRIRWSGSPEPTSNFIIDGQPTTLFDPSKLDLSYWQPCYPNNKITLDVVARFDKDEECYGWTAENYLYNWRNPKFKLPAGRYLVRIEVLSGGLTVSETYKLENSLGINEFRLTEVTKEEKSRVRT